MTSLFDSIIVRNAFQQITALKYPSTSGTILTSGVSRQDGGEQPSYKLAVSYEYTVNGQKYTSRQYRYGSFGSSDSTWARNTAQNLPPGKTVPVFYRPTNPSDAVLAAGLQGSDLFLLAFMTPFNVVSLVFIWLGGRTLARRWRHPIAGGAKIIPWSNGTLVRHSPIPAFGAGLAAIALTAFISLFPVCFFAGGFDPSVRTMEVVWSIILTSGLAAALWHWTRIRSGKYDLLLDTRTQTLSLPKTNSRTLPKRVPFANIQSVRIETVEKAKSDNGSVMVYVPTLRLTGKEGGSATLPEWSNANDAQAFVGWLDTTLRKHGTPLNAPVPPPEQKA